MKVLYNITNKCNNDCIQCFRNIEEEELSIENIYLILKKLQLLNTDEINWSGGEFFLSKNCLEILKLTKELNLFCTVSSNGSLINENILNNYFKYIDKIVFSVDNFDDNLNKQNGYTGNHFEQIKKLIPKIKAINPSIIIKIDTVLMSTNVNNFKDIVSIILQLNIDIWKINKFIPLRYNAIKNKQYLEITKETFNSVTNIAELYNSKINVIVENPNYYDDKLIISPQGNLIIFDGHKETVVLEKFYKKNISTIKKMLNLTKLQQNNFQSLNLYKTFCDVASAGSFSLASKQNFISQPALSKSIKKLESNLQVQLFNRTKTGINLTEKGRKLLFFVEQAFNSLNIAEQIISYSDENAKGKLSIGIASHLIDAIIGKQLKEFLTTYSNIELTLSPRSSRSLINLLKSHEISFIIDSFEKNFDLGELSLKQIGIFENCFFCLNSSNWALNEFFNINNLSDIPIILPFDFSNDRKQLDSFLIIHNIKFNKIITAGIGETIIRMVKNDYGIGYINKVAIQNELDAGIFREIKINETLPNTELKILYNESFLTQIPRNFLKKYFKEFDKI